MQRALAERLNADDPRLPPVAPVCDGRRRTASTRGRVAAESARGHYNPRVVARVARPPRLAFVHHSCMYSIIDSLVQLYEFLI